MMMKLRSMLALMLALMMVLIMVLPLCASAQDEEEEALFYVSEDAMTEEDSTSVFEVIPGSYEWYMLPSDIEDDHAYVDIYPSSETVALKNGAWHYAFTMEEVGGVSFYPYSVILVGFSDGVEVTRNIITAASAENWWAGEIPAGGVVTYSGTETNLALTALAISVIGTDDSGYELEFHSMVFLNK